MDLVLPVPVVSSDAGATLDDDGSLVQWLSCRAWVAGTDVTGRVML